MSDSPSIGDYLLRFGDTESTGDHEVRAERFIEGRADRDIEIEKQPLEKFYDERFRIPDYQREYEWEKEEWENLWEELEVLINVDPTSTNWIMNDIFFGSMFFSERDAAEVIHPDEEGTVLDIIDGQQRITTLSIVFKILADELSSGLSNCEPAFIGRHSHHVGDTNRLIFNTSDPDSGVSLTLDNNDDDFYQHLVKGPQERLDYILQCEVVNNNTIYGAIQVSEYLKLVNINEDEYLKELFDEERFGDSGGDKPNLDTSRGRIVDNADSPDSLSNAQRKKLLDNKVEFDKVSERLAKSYDYFNSRITGVLGDYSTAEQRYRAAANIKEYILNDYYVGYFEVKDNRPQLLMRIFEVLNDRGVNLKKTDLIRTRLVTRLRDEEADEELYNEYIRKWRDVIKTFGKEHDVIIDFLTTYFVTIDTSEDEYRQVTSRGEVSNHLLEAFELREQTSENRVLSSYLTNIEDTTNLIDSIKKYASYYHDIKNPAENGFQLDSVDESTVSRCNQILLRLDRSNSDIWEPIVLAFYHDIDNGMLGTGEDLLRLLQTVESLVIRYYVSGDINAKDSIYSNGISAYHATSDPNETLERMIETVLTDDSVTGQDLIDSLCTTEWDSNRSKQVFRMIESSYLERQNEGVITKRLNRDNNVVHLEHIFPSSPLLPEGQKYDWVTTYFQLDSEGAENPNYFNLNTEEYDLLEEGLSNFGEVLSGQIESESDQVIEDISEQFSSSLGNHLLLWYETNVKISNNRYSSKLPAYGATNNFAQLITSRYLRESHMSSEEYSLVALRYVLQYTKEKIEGSDENYNRVINETIEEHESNPFYDTTKIRSELESVQEKSSSSEEAKKIISERINSEEIIGGCQAIDQQWTLESTTKNLVKILELLADVLKFDAVSILDDEFDDVNIKYRAQREMNRKRGVIGYNYAE